MQRTRKESQRSRKKWRKYGRPRNGILGFGRARDETRAIFRAIFDCCSSFFASELHETIATQAGVGPRGETSSYKTLWSRLPHTPGRVLLARCEQDFLPEFLLSSQLLSRPGIKALAGTVYVSLKCFHTKRKQIPVFQQNNQTKKQNSFRSQFFFTEHN